MDRSCNLNSWISHYCIFINPEHSSLQLPTLSAVCLFTRKMATTDPNLRTSTSINELTTALHHPNSQNSNPCFLWRLYLEHYPPGFLRKVYHKSPYMHTGFLFFFSRLGFLKSHVLIHHLFWNYTWLTWSTCRWGCFLLFFLFFFLRKLFSRETNIVWKMAGIWCWRWVLSNRW